MPYCHLARESVECHTHTNTHPKVQVLEVMAT